MTLQSEAAALVIAGSRGTDTASGNHRLALRYGHSEAAAAIADAKERQTSLIYSLRQAATQAAVLTTQLEAATTTATALKSNLEAIKTTAAVDLEDSNAGDSALSAITTLLSAFSTAATAIRAIPNLTYASYRDA